MPERTYRLADGELIYGQFGFVSDTDYFDDGDACDVIEEEWMLVRSRTLRLGFSELCAQCHGEQEIDCTPTDEYPEGKWPCNRCGGDGYEPRDDDPPWTDHLPASIDATHLAHQREWSLSTFGPGARLLGVLDHIRKELGEIEADPTDLAEWVDVIILAFDGAWRAGWEPQEIINAIVAKQARNEARTWPDWRTMSPDAAIEHVRDGEMPDMRYECVICHAPIEYGDECACDDLDHCVEHCCPAVEEGTT